MSLEDSINRLADSLDKLATLHEKGLMILQHARSAPPTATTGEATSVTVATRRGRPPKEPELSAADLAPDEDQPKYADVRAAVERCVTRKNPAAALAALEGFGVTNAKALKAEQYADAIAALDKA
jgi:hypothetical protein